MPNSNEAAASTAPLRSDIAAVWGAFLMEGLLDTLSRHAKDGEPIHSDQRAYAELVSASCTWLPCLWERIEPWWESPVFDSPGAFESEVVSELGSVFAEHYALYRCMPHADNVQRIITELISSFLLDYEISDPPDA